MADEKTYDGVVKLFLGGRWRDVSCAMSARHGDLFISAFHPCMLSPLTMQMDVDLFIRIADLLREEDEEIEDCEDAMDIDDQIFDRLEAVEEELDGSLAILEKELADLKARVDKLENPRPTVNNRHSGGYYVVDFPSDLVARLVNS
jgi:hypothetical protein